MRISYGARCEVLQGVDHPNIVRPISPPLPAFIHYVPARPRRCLTVNMFGLSFCRVKIYERFQSRTKTLPRFGTPLSAAKSLRVSNQRIHFFGTTRRCWSMCFCTFDRSPPGYNNQRLIRLLFIASAQFRGVPCDVPA